MPDPNKIVGIDSPTKAPPTSSNIISGTKVPTFFPGCLTSCLQRWLLSASLPRGSKRGNLLSQSPCQDRVRGLWRNAGLWCWWESSSVKTSGLWLACRAFMTVSVCTRWPHVVVSGYIGIHMCWFSCFFLWLEMLISIVFLGHGSGVETSHQTLTADCCSSGAKLFPFMAVASHRAELSGSLPCFVSQRVEGCLSAGGECLVVTVYDLIFSGLKCGWWLTSLVLVVRAPSSFFEFVWISELWHVGLQSLTRPEFRLWPWDHSSLRHWLELAWCKTPITTSFGSTCCFSLRSNEGNRTSQKRILFLKGSTSTFIYNFQKWIPTSTVTQSNGTSSEVRVAEQNLNKCIQIYTVIKHEVIWSSWPWPNFCLYSPVDRDWQD